MNLKKEVAVFVLLLSLGFGNINNVSGQTREDTLNKQLSRLNIIRAQEPIGAKNELLQLISNFPESGTKEQLFITYTLLGSAFERISQPDSARYAFEKAHKLFSDDFELRNQFDFRKTFGSYYSLIQAYDSAVIQFEIAVKLAEKIDQPYYYAAAYNGMGNVALDLIQMNNAFEYFLKAVHYFEEADDIENMAIVYNNLGLVNEKMGNYERGIQYFNEAININRANNSVYDLSMNFSNLGVLYKEAGRFQEAIVVFDSSTKIAEENGFVMDLARNKLNLGNLFVKIKDFDSAEKNFLESLEICEESNTTYGMMLNNIGLSQLYLQLNALEKAETYAIEALEIAKQFDEIEAIKESNLKLSLIAEQRKQYKTALEYRKTFEAYNDSVISRAHKNLILELQTRYDTEKKELENSSLKAENLVKEQAIKDQKIINIIISIALLIMALLLFFVFRVRNKLKRANQNLNLLNQKIASQNTILEETINTKDKLFSIIGHDLKSPFNSMLGYLQIMIDQKDDIDPEERVLILNKIYSKSNDTYTLVENLLQWAMSQRGQIAFKPDHHDLFELIDDELRFLQSRADKKQIQLSNNLSDNIQIWCDWNMISIVFRNIINNAIKFTPVKGFVKLSAEVKSDFVFVTISDSGVGMDAETINKIQLSTEFYSLRGTENESGTGLGLKIVKDFLAANQAIYTIKSSPGEGTDFVIRFNKNN